MSEQPADTVRENVRLIHRAKRRGSSVPQQPSCLLNLIGKWGYVQKPHLRIMSP